jgi:hypothetical protein
MAEAQGADQEEIGSVADASGWALADDNGNDVFTSSRSALVTIPLIARRADDTIAR